MKAIRGLYETFGADSYYDQHGHQYANPHTEQVQELVRRNSHRWDCASGVLDFCAGGGEVTSALKDAGFPLAGSDPYTHVLYEQNTGIRAEPWSFDDLVRGQASLGQYGVIICSFALHLCPEKDLFPVTWTLLEAAPVLVVITPHKRPELEKLPSIELEYEDFVLTERGKKVRLKGYVRKG